MLPIYQLAVIGSPSDAQLRDLEDAVKTAVALYGLRLGQEISWEITPDMFTPNQLRSSAVVFFCGVGVDHPSLPSLLRSGTPVIPIVSDLRHVSAEVPELLRPLNCLTYANGGAKRVSIALLECAGLLPKQRRCKYTRFSSTHFLRFRYFQLITGILPVSDYSGIHVDAPGYIPSASVP